MIDIADLGQASPVMPVVQVETPDEAVSIAKALSEGGVGVIEITLRTEQALAAIQAVRAACPQMIVGAGTILCEEDVEDAQEAGAHFLVTPGTSWRLADALLQADIPALPGVATPSELMALADIGFSAFKLFPATQLGGAAFLKALEGPFPNALFCPTGGIGLGDIPDYLARPNVICVGGSWVTPRDAIAAGDWARITQLAKKAVAFRVSA